MITSRSLLLYNVENEREAMIEFEKCNPFLNPDAWSFEKVGNGVFRATPLNKRAFYELSVSHFYKWVK